MSRMLRVDQLVAHPANPRDAVGDVTDLASSIRSVGILHPLVVFEAPAKPGTYVVLDGHRRLAAARLLGHREVPSEIRTDARGIDEQLVLMLIANVQRSDLGPVEKAEAFGLLRRRGMSLPAIAAAVGLAESTVSYYLTLNDLAPQTLEDVREGRVEVGRAIDAVRDARAAQRSAYRRTSDGPITRRPPPVPTTVEPAHFTNRHPLATEWARRCHHKTRPRIAGACGQCIEAVIRADERAREAVA